MQETTILDKEVFDVIHERYNDIFSAEKKVADFILKNPNVTVEFTVSELAKNSGVSDATVVRMCHHLGYKGYYQFRITLARDVGKKQYGEAAPSKSNSLIEDIFNNYADNISAIGKSVDKETIYKSVNLLKTCNTVHLIAMGNTITMTQYVQFRLGRLGIRSTAGASAEYYMNHINLANPDDIVLAISKSGASKPVILGLELAKEKGLKSIAITSYDESPSAHIADFPIYAKDKDASFNYYKDYAHTSIMATIDALLELLTSNETIESKHADVPELLLSEYKL